MNSSCRSSPPLLYYSERAILYMRIHKFQVSKSRPGAPVVSTTCRQRHSVAISLALVTLLLCFLSRARAQQQKAPSTVSQPSVQLPKPPSGQLTQPSIPAAAQPHPPELRFAVMLDPAHGGADNGAILGAATLEKNYTLALAIRLHVLLNARGIRSSFTRDSDTMVDNTARAIAANRAHASACILLHATATGNGVHLFTSSLPATARPVSQDPHRTFLPWQTAQASYGTESLRLESDVNAALAAQHVPVLLDRTSLMPLDTLACPAVVIEIAPLNSNTPLTDAAYQTKIAQALAAALVAWRTDWRLQP
jgi:N-acetylmuramoyl-L-alanine amidase